MGGQSFTEEVGWDIPLNTPISDTRISFEEFVPIYQTVAKSRAHPSLEQFIEGLSHFDREGNGTIAVAVLCLRYR